MIQTDLAYFLPCSGFNNRVTKNFLREYGSCADKTVYFVQMDNKVQQDNMDWNRGVVYSQLFSLRVFFFLRLVVGYRVTVRLVWYRVAVQLFFLFFIHIFNIDKVRYTMQVYGIKVPFRIKTKYKLKIHQCRIENLPICSNSYKNNTLKVSHS